MTTSRFPKMTCPKPRPYLTGWVIAVLAAGCGGGGDDTSNDSTHEVAEVAAMPGPVFAEAESGAGATESALRRRTTPPPPAPTGVTCGLPDFQASALARINQYRASGADCRSAGRFASAQPLVWESRLAQAAAGHSQDMAVKNYFSHTSPTGSTMVSRINATGYSWSTIGENIAAGYPTVNAVIDGWMASDGHCANLMNPNFRDAALACVASSTSTYRSYWTLDLGRQR